MSTSTLEAYFTGPGEDSKDALMEGSAEAAGEAESVDATSSVRHSSRVRKPSRRAEEMAASSLPDSQSQLAKAIGLDRTDGERLGKGAKGRSGSQASKRSANLDDNGQSGGSEADEDDEGVYCLCRKGDDGKPMVLCGACNDWCVSDDAVHTYDRIELTLTCINDRFHFKCVGLTKKAAEFVTVFICPPCEKATGRQSRGEYRSEIAAWCKQCDGRECWSSMHPGKVARQCILLALFETCVHRMCPSLPATVPWMLGFLMERLSAC